MHYCSTKRVKDQTKRVIVSDKHRKKNKRAKEKKDDVVKVMWEKRRG